MIYILETAIEINSLRANDSSSDGWRMEEERGSR
jgi:hypothetical protein